ncbi:MAG: pyridoxamine 5'-phosphate oxidase family protein [Clostridiales bacterium]|nr:pyridoxamine 5'-phosphate oxidase family protein [Clostridiales bacterium]
MKRVYDFLKSAETYYLATTEGDQPHVRPFGTINEFEGKLYIQTGKSKPVSEQIHKNPKAEICAFKDGTWLRVECTLREDDRREARKAMLDAYPDLRAMYNEDDGNTEVFAIENAFAVFYSFTAEPVIVKF